MKLDIPIGELVFARQIENREYSNAQVLDYNESRTEILVQWLLSQKKCWLPNDSSLIMISERPRVRRQVKMTTSTDEDNDRPTRLTRSKESTDIPPSASTSSGLSKSSGNKVFRVMRTQPVKRTIIDVDSTEEEQEDESEADEDDFEPLQQRKNPRPRAHKRLKLEESLEDSDDAEEEIDVSDATKLAGISISECDEAMERSFYSLHRYKNFLEPFVSPTVMKKLKSSVVDTEKAKSKNFSNQDHDDIVAQPHTLSKSCTMRSYQIEGLSWLVKQYDMSINSILGDEMGLG